MHFHAHSLLELLLYSVLSISFVEDALGIILFVLHILLNRVFIMIEHDFLIDEIFIIFFLKRVNFEVEIKRRHQVSCWLVIREMQLTHVWVLQCLIYSYTLQGIKSEHPSNQVNCVGIRAFEYRGEVFRLSLR